MKRFFCYRRPNAAGFTLIELLAVIVIIAMLLSIAITAAQWVFRTARVKRYEMTCHVFETAIARYHHDYKVWPIPEKDYKDDTYEYTFSGKNNAVCLSMLRSSHEENNKKIPFLDEAGLFVEKNGKMMPLTAAGAGSFPFVYRSRQNNVSYYRVTIDVEAETIKVN